MDAIAFKYLIYIIYSKYHGLLKIVWVRHVNIYNITNLSHSIEISLNLLFTDCLALNSFIASQFWIVCSLLKKYIDARLLIARLVRDSPRRLWSSHMKSSIKGQILFNTASEKRLVSFLNCSNCFFRQSRTTKHLQRLQREKIAVE